MSKISKIPKVEVFESIYSGSEVEEFLKKYNFALKDVYFEKRYVDSYSNTESVVVSGYRDATAKEIDELKKQEENRQKANREYRKKQFEELKKEFGE